MDNNDYNKLGGWLLVFAIFLALGLISIAISVIQAFTLIRYGFFLGRLVILLLFYIASAGMLVRCLMGIYKRKPEFLRDYEIFILINIVFIFFRSPNVFAILMSLIGPVLWRLYFHKSVRARTYMGGEEYLSKSLLAKFLPAGPAPAGGMAGGGNTDAPGSAGFCKICGAPLRLGSNFCSTCGADNA